MKTTYDSTSKDSILAYAQQLLGKSLRDLHPEAATNNTGRGRLGQCVEYFHFGYKPNSEAQADFPDAGVELKCTPLKTNTDGSMVSKERLVLNIIDYVEEATKTFETSSFWHKNQLLLLMFYLHENGIDVIDLIFKIIRLWSFPEEDLKIIKDDWNKIHHKIVTGHAHELSEGDTFYLGACTKGSKGGANKRAQYGTSIKADQRAYSIKSKYINTIIFDSLLHPEMTNGMFLSQSQLKKIEKEIRKSSNIVKNIDEYEDNETFEQLIERRFLPYYGKTLYDIESMLNVKFSSSPKAISYDVIRHILGVKTPKIKEFEKASIQQKSIRLEPNGKLKESMVFSQIDYNEIIKEENWEDSVWHNTLTQRFLFIVFRKDASNDDKKAVLEKVFFWTMPSKDLLIASKFWEDTKNKINNGDYDHFIKASDHQICHVRPKAQDSHDLMDTKDGPQKKKGYWLNREYIYNIVNEELYKDAGT